MDSQHQILALPLPAQLDRYTTPLKSVVFGLGKFYGTSLPRCRIYIDVKCNDRLVDPQFASPSTLPHIVHEDTADLNVGGVSNRSGRRQHARQIWTLTM
ncbi:hypothetical protein JHK82_039333 [Glycine max]|nr:hypothetical protein JHK85_040089 [Glycine max]KAG5110110.1 hypothetical protein JHK82_039333 [Glycine max]KAG5121395.1 hypothetical protein JHK84_039735 [Glycine max]